MKPPHTRPTNPLDNLLARLALPLLAFALLVIAPPARATDAEPTRPSEKNLIDDARPTSLAQNKGGPAPFDAFPAAAAKRDIRGRAVSENVAAQLAARMPHYAPPPEPTSGSESSPAQKRDATGRATNGSTPSEKVEDLDRPQNQIIRLPDYVVREKKPPVFRERDLYNPSGLAALAALRYLSETSQALNRFRIPLIGNADKAYALARYEEDERLRNRRELTETALDVGLLQASDAEGAAAETALRRLIRDTTTRPATEARSKLPQ